jgi:hypothetical protein
VALSDEAPLGTTTPLEAAVRGLRQWTRENERPGRTMVAVLITDGSATDCAGTGTLASVASASFADGIPMFTLGMDGASFSTLNDVAEAGGVASHFDFCSGFSPCFAYNVGSGDPEPFLAALSVIRRSVASCTFVVPTRGDAGSGAVNVDALSVVIEDGATRSAVSRVAGPSSCSPEGGFYYDDEGAPGRLSLCPGSCGLVRQSETAVVKLDLGCLGI